MSCELYRGCSVYDADMTPSFPGVHTRCGLLAIYKYTMAYQSNTTKLYYVYYCIRTTCFDSYRVIFRLFKDIDPYLAMFNPYTRKRYVYKHNLITEVYLMTVMETTTCFGLCWPSSDCLGNLRASYMHARYS